MRPADDTRPRIKGDGWPHLVTTFDDECCTAGITLADGETVPGSCPGKTVAIVHQVCAHLHIGDLPMCASHLYEVLEPKEGGPAICCECRDPVTYGVGDASDSHDCALWTRAITVVRPFAI